MSSLSNFLLTCVVTHIVNVASLEREVLEYVSPPFVEVTEDAFLNQEISQMLKLPDNYHPTFGKTGIAYSVIYYIRNARLAAQYAYPRTLTFGEETIDDIWQNLFRMEMEIFSSFRQWFDESNSHEKWLQFSNVVARIFDERVRPYMTLFSTSDKFEIRMPVYKDNGLGPKFLSTMNANLPSDVELNRDQPFIPLLDDKFPLIGFGSWQLTGNRCKDAVLKALKTGYRLIDTSENYNNEEAIGEAIRQSGVDREEILIASKVSYNQNYGKGATTKAFEKSLSNLGVDYMDVYMLHGAISDKQRLKEAWLEMEALYNEGKIKYLAVSNFGANDMQELLRYATVKPTFVQNKYDPFTQGQQAPWGAPIEQWVTNYNERLRAKEDPIMLVQGYCTLNSWPHQVSAVNDQHIKWIADKYNATTAQLLLRWILQHKYLGVLTRSSKQDRQLNNLDAFKFEISDVDMQLINGLNTLLSPFDIGWMNDVYGHITNRPQLAQLREEL